MQHIGMYIIYNRFHRHAYIYIYITIISTHPFTDTYTIFAQCPSMLMQQTGWSHYFFKVMLFIWISVLHVWLICNFLRSKLLQSFPSWICKFIFSIAYQDFLFFTLWPVAIMLCLPDGRTAQVWSQASGLWLVFPWWWQMLHFFLLSSDCMCIFLGKLSTESRCPFLIRLGGIFLCLVAEFYGFLENFGF